MCLSVSSCFAVSVHNDGRNSRGWPQGVIIGFSTCAVVLLVLLILAVALIVTHRHLLATKWRLRRGRRRVDGGSDRRDQEQTLAIDETCKRLLDPAAVTPATTAPCGDSGVEFYLKVVTPDSAGDNLSPSSASSGENNVKLMECRQLGDGSTCYDSDVCATLRRDILAATADAAWNCELCRCERSSSTLRAKPVALPALNVDESSTSSHHCSWASYPDRSRCAGIGPTAGDWTIPRCRLAAPCFRSRFTESSMASTVRRPRSWCSCMHVDDRLYNNRSLSSAIVEPRDGLPRCGNVIGNDRCHVTTLDRRCRHKPTTASSRSSLQAT